MIISPFRAHSPSSFRECSANHNFTPAERETEDIPLWIYWHWHPVAKPIRKWESLYALSYCCWSFLCPLYYLWFYLFLFCPTIWTVDKAAELNEKNTVHKFLFEPLLYNSVIPFVDGGTEGFKGNVRVILPGMSACIECTLDLFPPQVLYAHETIKLISCNAMKWGKETRAKLADRRTGPCVWRRLSRPLGPSTFEWP